MQGDFSLRRMVLHRGDTFHHFAKDFRLLIGLSPPIFRFPRASLLPDGFAIPIWMAPFESAFLWA